MHDFRRCCLAVTAAAAIAHAAHAVDVAGYWRFEEIAGATVLDETGFAHDGTLNALPFLAGDVPVDPVPSNALANTQSLDLNWQSTSSGGFFTVADPTGQLSFGDRSFTLEAWVKLDHVSNTNSAEQQQWLFMKKPLPSGDANLDYALLVQAGPFGTTGRELAFRYGDGASFFGIVSTLEIADTNWHHVSLAYDGSALRFGVDGVFDTVPFAKPGFIGGLPLLNTGVLRIGSHQNSMGTNNRFVRGSIDEVRITRGFLGPDQLLDAADPDCNGNFVPDILEVTDGTSPDCNGNGIPDECDIASGFSGDCQPDGIPDECQPDGFLYGFDDGTIEATVSSDGDYTAWLDLHTVRDGVGVITHVDIEISELAVGGNATIYVWSDPNNDGDPTDAQVLSSLPVAITAEIGDTLTRFDVPDVNVGPDGTNFFVGAVMEITGFGPRADVEPPHVFGVSWVIGRNTLIDPNDLSDGAVEFALIESSFPANWSLRAVNADTAFEDCNQNGVPDFCDIDEGTSDDLDRNGIPDECEDTGPFFVPGDFATIQQAIDVAAEGATIIVLAGTYFENLDFKGKALHVVSQDGPLSTLIDAGGNGSGVAFMTGEGADSILEGFAITNANASGVVIQNASPVILDNLLFGNTGSAGGGILCTGTSAPTIRGNDFLSNSAGDGGAIALAVSNTAPVIQDNRFIGNSADNNGGAIVADNASPVISRNLFDGNSCNGSGGALFWIFSAGTPPRIMNNVFRNNDAGDDGGAIWYDAGGNPAIANNLFHGNTSPFGAAIYCRDDGNLVNNTFTGNSAGVEGGALYFDNNEPIDITGSIFWNNSAPSSPELFFDAGASPVVTWCNVAGGWPGVGNIDADPQFVDAANDDFRLSAGSPCIDAGSNSALPADGADLDDDGDVLEPIPLDLDDATRTVDDSGTPDTGEGTPPIVDMGAYEVPVDCPFDFDGSGTVDTVDLLQLLGAWGNPYTVVDLLDLLGAWGDC